MSIHQPPSLAELQKIHPPLRNVNAEHRQHLSQLERLALWITRHVGTMGFFIIIFIWTVTWLSWNSIGPKNLRFDPLPGFVLWLFISNMIQIFLMPLIMIGQNLESRHSEARAEADYEVNVRAEREIEAILMHLENLDQRLASLEGQKNKTR
ncbi:MAG: DUF1003 domain-containing protein [Candidatus Kerfeldbacteria bacterium]|nr:DUF1003 domain-containing protein [Candidatus Kerfeldbacteria bacterium]